VWHFVPPFCLPNFFDWAVSNVISFFLMYLRESDLAYQGIAIAHIEDLGALRNCSAFESEVAHSSSPVSQLGRSTCGPKTKDKSTRRSGFYQGKALTFRQNFITVTVSIACRSDLT
jgi:hypothetical protein